MSIVKEDSDLLSVFLAHPETFCDEYIIDELVSLYFASVATSALLSATLLVHFIKEPTSLERVRAELQAEIESEIAENPDFAAKTLREQLDGVIDLKRVHSLNYLSMCFQEALRYQGPAYTSSNIYLTQDAKAGPIDIQEGDEIIINYYGLHYSSAEWQRPYEFLPERWDPQSPLYLTPSGKKRHAFSWTPFNGGRRSCIGQTFAEKNIKTVLVYLVAYFDFAFARPAQLEEPYPLSHLGQNKKVPIQVQITAKEQSAKE